MDHLPRIVLASMFDLDSTVAESAFEEWHRIEHVSERLACPGFLAVHRYRALAASPRYLIIYELAGAWALATPEYRALMSTVNPAGSGSAQTRSMLTAMRDLHRNVFLQIDSAPRPDS